MVELRVCIGVSGNEGAFGGGVLTMTAATCKDEGVAVVYWHYWQWQLDDNKGLKPAEAGSASLKPASRVG